MKNCIVIFMVLFASHAAIASGMPPQVKQLTEEITSNQEAKNLADDFAKTLKERNYDLGYKLLNPRSSTLTKDIFIQSNIGAEERFGPWEKYIFVNPSIQTINNPETGEKQYVPAYLYEIDLTNYSTKLLLVILMDITPGEPRIIAYHYMPKNTIEHKKTYEME